MPTDCLFRATPLHHVADIRPRGGQLQRDGAAYQLLYQAVQSIH
ncbi:MAG TPA: hypothetical protein VGH38_08995 [Bryobacteraceae bacterium]|jgi:hypothetical protein